MTKTAAPTTRVLFTWTEDLYFYWHEEDADIPAGSSVLSSQLWPADPNERNQVTLSHRNGIYRFRDLTEGPNPGRLYVVQDASVVADRAVVGLGMSGFGAHVLPAQPNMTLTFKPAFTYCIAFGSYIQGASLDVSSSTAWAPIPFPRGVRAVTATLRRNNTWSIKSARRANRRAAKTALTLSALPSQK